MRNGAGIAAVRKTILGQLLSSNDRPTPPSASDLGLATSCSTIFSETVASSSSRGDVGSAVSEKTSATSTDRVVSCGFVGAAPSSYHWPRRKSPAPSPSSSSASPVSSGGGGGGGGGGGADVAPHSSASTTTPSPNVASQRRLVEKSRNSSRNFVGVVEARPSVRSV